MTGPIDLNGMPLTIQRIHEIVFQLCSDGEVHVVNCPALGAQQASHLLHLMSTKLSDADKKWLRDTIAEETSKPKRPWFTT